MRLRNPGGADAALATVMQVKNQLSNANVQGNNASERKNAFLTWCDQWANRQLGNHFPASEDLFAELAVSYHRVLQTPQLAERELNMLVARECREWDARLERLIGEIQGRLVVLDTSALMEGVFFTDFDWHLLDPSLRNAARLVVPWLVVEELDDLKRHRDGRQKAQACRVLTALWDLRRAAPAEPAALPGRADVTIEVLLDGGWRRCRTFAADAPPSSPPGLCRHLLARSMRPEPARRERTCQAGFLPDTKPSTTTEKQMASHLPEVCQDFRDRMEDDGLTGAARDQVLGANAKHLVPGGAPATGQLR
jgi:hypothetical protein